MDRVERYITQNEFASIVTSGRFYEGYVVGVGYAWIDTQTIAENSNNGIFPDRGTPLIFSELQIVNIQRLDDSEAMIIWSLRQRFPKGFRRYEVQKGDTLTKISRETGFSIAKIAEWNDIENIDMISEGEILFLDNSDEYDRMISRLKPLPCELPDPGEIKQYKPNLFERAHQSRLGRTWVGKIIYGSFDDLWITMQCFTVGRSRAFHLSGNYIEGQDALDAGINTLLSFMPVRKIAKPGNTVNAGQFNKLNKGTGVTASQRSGYYIRQHNNNVSEMNSFLSTYGWIQYGPMIPYIFEADSIR